MEAMYRKYRDRVDFRLIYIKEAHAADSLRSVPYAIQLGIQQPTSYRERCEVAAKLHDDKHLSIPCLIDVMQNSVNVAYGAFPDRLFVIRTDGRIGIAAARGPRGFAPGLQQAQLWLKEFARTGREPALPPDAVAAGRERDVTAKSIPRRNLLRQR